MCSNAIDTIYKIYHFKENSCVNLERYGNGLGIQKIKTNLIEQQTSSREFLGKTKITGFNTTLANLVLPYLQTIPCGKRPKN